MLAKKESKKGYNITHHKSGNDASMLLNLFKVLSIVTVLLAALVALITQGRNEFLRSADEIEPHL